MSERPILTSLQERRVVQLGELFRRLRAEGLSEEAASKVVVLEAEALIRKDYNLSTRLEHTPQTVNLHVESRAPAEEVTAAIRSAFETLADEPK